MSVTDRKMFRPRNARNRLNQLGGIMASSPELMQTIQRFERGGPVSLGAGLKAAMPGDMTASQYMMASPIVQQKLLDAENRYRALNRVSSAALNLPKALVDLTTGSGAGLTNLVTSGAQGLGFIDPTQDYRVRGTNLVGSNIEQGLSFPQVNNPEEYAALLATSRGEFQDPSIQRAMDEVPQTMENPLLGDTFVFGASAPSGDQINTMGLTTPNKEPTPNKENPFVGNDLDAQEGVGPGNQGEDSRLTAAKRGELGAKAQVQAVVAAGTPAEQQDQLKQLMNEFTSNAPEYEGIDKGLALAKIGFAMAAGKSPRALENIANALNQGADTFIKDKKERNAFNRQVQLSALQYGLGEVGKERAQKRLDERTFTDFIDPETQDTVRVSTADYFANGNKLPEGLMNKELYTKIQTAINEKNKAFQKLIQDSEARRFMKVDDQTKYRKDYSDLVTLASESETAASFLEKVISSAADKEITGGYAAAKSAAAKVGAIFGVELPESFTTRDRAIQDLKAALQPMVKVTLGATQSANSISDRDVNLLIQGFLADGIMKENADGVLNFVAVPPEVFVNSLQNGLRQIRLSQARSLTEMSAIEGELAELYTPGGRIGTSVIAPYQQKRASSTPQQDAKTLSLDPKTGQYFVPDFN